MYKRLPSIYLNEKPTYKKDSRRSGKKRSAGYRNFLNALPKIFQYLKHILENLAILALIIMFIANRYSSNDVINKFKLEFFIYKLYIFEYQLYCVASTMRP